VGIRSGVRVVELWVNVDGATGVEILNGSRLVLVGAGAGAGAEKSKSSKSISGAGTGSGAEGGIEAGTGTEGGATAVGVGVTAAGAAGAGAPGKIPPKSAAAIFSFSVNSLDFSSAGMAVAV